MLIDKILLPLCFLALALSGTALAIQELPTPTIAVNPDVYYPFDEVLYIEGRAAPKETVQVRFFKQGAEPVLFTTKSDANGEWVLAKKVSLEEGDWEVRARVYQDSGAASQWSNPRVFKAVITGITIGGINIKFAALTFIIVVLLMFSGGLTWYFDLRVKQQMREKAEELEKKLHDKQRESIETLVEHNFDKVHERIAEELKRLNNKFLEKGRLSSEEEEHQEQLLKDLRRCEEEIAKKLKDI